MSEGERHPIQPEKLYGQLNLGLPEPGEFLMRRNAWSTVDVLEAVMANAVLSGLSESGLMIL